MEIITEAGPGSGEGGFCPLTAWTACILRASQLHLPAYSLSPPVCQLTCIITRDFNLYSVLPSSAIVNVSPHQLPFNPRHSQLFQLVFQRDVNADLALVLHWGFGRLKAVAGSTEIDLKHEWILSMLHLVLYSLLSLGRKILHQNDRAVGGPLILFIGLLRLKL